jgi:type VI secretion system protein ImpF
MADLLPEERLQPALLDRLTDDEPEKTRESRRQRLLTMAKLRQSVLRDLTWLLNTGCLGQTQDLAAYPHAARSVLNYGVTDLAGTSIGIRDLGAIESSVRQAILNFEPRILPETVKVRTVMEEGEMNRRALTFEIRGQLWAHPIPLELFLKTEVDLETGNVDVFETGV